MSFHEATFRLLGNELRVSTAIKTRLEVSEHRLGISLPASVRDWYQRQYAIRALADHSNEDPPIEVSKFELTQWGAKTLMPIRHENQGVCTWAVEIDGSDNPAVFVDVDTNGTHWIVVTESFSDYVYSCVWDFKIVLNQPALVQAQNCQLTDAARNVLAKTLRHELTTHGWPGNAQYRFHDSGFAALIWDSEGQADWFVGARDAESLRVGLEFVWDLDALGDSFYDCSEIGRDVLSELRSRPNTAFNRTVNRP